jgi:RNA polymerase sigma-70 factor (ECF subfamily)
MSHVTLTVTLFKSEKIAASDLSVIFVQLRRLKIRAAKCILLGWAPLRQVGQMQYRERFSGNVSLSSLPEGMLVELAQKGDQAAFQELIVRVRESCVRMATAILRNRDDAEEEVQNALCRAFTHLALFNHQSTFATWVTRIVINHCFMRYRRARRLRFVSFEATGSDGESYAAYEPTGSDTPEAGLGRDQVRTLLRQELRYIPSLLRIPLEMRFLQDRSIDEVAGTLGISVAAAKSRLHRAQGYLKDRMSRHCGRRGAATLMHMN